MSDHVYKIVEIVGSSHLGVDDAIRNAIETSAQTLRHISWFEVVKTTGHVVDGKVELGIKVFLPKDHEEWDGAKRQECSSEFVQNLLAVSADWKKLKLFSDRLVLNAAFLVDKSSIDEFSEQVGKLTGKYEHLKVQYSGPWPAYNFVDIHILGGKRRGFR